MNKQIPWYYLCGGGLLAHLVPVVLGGSPITYGIGVVGDLAFLFGLIELVRQYIKRRNAKKQGSAE